jgi:outer membrane protein
VAEAEARLRRLKEQKILLREGLGLRLRELFLGLDASEKACQAASDAMVAAKEDSDLTTRGYGAGLLTTEKVIRVQIQEALVASSYYKAIYDHAALEAEIDRTVGAQVQKAVEAAR